MAFPNDNLPQTAVYWGTPTEDGYGGLTFASPAEISCRWEESEELIRTNDGEEKMSHAKVFVATDLDENGYLFLGDLDDLDSGQEADPTTVTGAYQIMRFDKIPGVNSTSVFLRRAWL